MSRHRNIRKLNYDEECEIDDVYGRSMEEEHCISPSTAAEFMYDRNAQAHSFSHYLTSDDDILEEKEEQTYAEKLSDFDEARLRSCLDEICNVVGDNIPESILREAIVANNFDVEKSLDAVLTKAEEPRHFRPGRTNSEAVTDRKETSPIGKDINERFLNNGEMPAKLNQIDKMDNVEKRIRVTPESLDSNNKNKQNDKFLTRTKEVAVSNQADSVSEFQKQRSCGKDLVNLVVIGHVDAGKSTLMGHLLYLVGEVSQKLMHKYEQESKKIGKTSFAYAWVLDETGDERNRGITMDVGRYKFETNRKVVTLLDAPGHKDFIPNMITGASQADVAILVVDATRGEFETGFESGGQTREHALLVRSLGVTQMVVAVNKLDTVSWSHDRFNEITKKLGQFLKQVGYKETDINYIPCSGLTGENLTTPPKEELLNAWYHGPTLLQQIDNFKPIERPISKPFRLSVGDVFKGQLSGLCVAGRVETGMLTNGEKVLVMPQGETAQVKSITIDDSSVPSAFAGDQVIVTLVNLDQTNVTIGSILCNVNNPIRATTLIRARIVIFNIDVPITKGFSVVFHYQVSSEPAVIKKLLSQLHKNTGEVVKKKPRCLSKQTSAVVDIEIGRPICVELYKDVKELGRFMLRWRGSTIAAGLVTEILRA